PDPIMDRGVDRVDQFMMSVFMKSGSVFDERIHSCMKVFMLFHLGLVKDRDQSLRNRRQETFW
ncbi:hypothetical protein, partial [Methanocalculus sp. AMF5]|uniref:hypothetical protein n=1 Tax=Methanocalculus sp. AMF5 TaxID=1198257 RepID=UPI00209CEB87